MASNGDGRRVGRAAAAGTDKTASQVLDEIRACAEAAPAERVAVGELIGGAGARLYGLALMLFALPEAIPFPAVGLTGLVAIPITVVSLSMLVAGMQRGLPAWICRRRVKRGWVVTVAHRGSGLVRRIERLSHPRYSRWTEYGRPLGLLCLLLSLVMAIPIPFSNVAPGVTVVGIGLGVFQRDGLLVLAASLAGLLIVAVAAGLLVLGWQVAVAA